MSRKTSATEQHFARQMEVTKLQLKRLRREDNGRKALYWIFGIMILVPMLGCLDQCGTKDQVHASGVGQRSHK